MSQFRIDYIILNAGLLGSCFLRRVEFTDPRNGGREVDLEREGKEMKKRKQERVCIQKERGVCVCLD